jgi:hypothetical protein
MPTELPGLVAWVGVDTFFLEKKRGKSQQAPLRLARSSQSHYDLRSWGKMPHLLSAEGSFMRTSPSPHLVLVWSLLLLLPASTQADSLLVTPNSLAVSPPLTLPAAHGVSVVSGGWVDQQYSSLGLWFSGAALTQINGVNVWTPASYLNGSTASLNYAPGSSIYVGFVDPVTQNAATTNLVSVEFIGVPPGRALMTAYDGSPNGSATLLDTDIGPHGGGLVTLQESGISGISLSRAFAGQTDLSNATNQPWGIAQIQIGDLTILPPVIDPPPGVDGGVGSAGGAPVPAPEPSTAMLALMGGVTALGSFCYRRR